MNKPKHLGLIAVKTVVLRRKINEQDKREENREEQNNLYTKCLNIKQDNNSNFAKIHYNRHRCSCLYFHRVKRTYEMNDLPPFTKTQQITLKTKSQNYMTRWATLSLVAQRAEYLKNGETSS